MKHPTLAQTRVCQGRCRYVCARRWQHRGCTVREWLRSCSLLCHSRVWDHRRLSLMVFSGTAVPKLSLTKCWVDPVRCLANGGDRRRRAFDAVPKGVLRVCLERAFSCAGGAARRHASCVCSATVVSMDAAGVTLHRRDAWGSDFCDFRMHLIKEAICPLTGVPVWFIQCGQIGANHLARRTGLPSADPAVAHVVLREGTQQRN